MVLKDLIRHDCPPYNDALRQLFERDPSLRGDPGRAAAIAAGLYEVHALAVGEPDKELLRPALLGQVVAGFSPMPVIHQESQFPRRLWWKVFAILDLAGLSSRERSVLGEAFSAFGYQEEAELSQASVMAFSALHEEPPRERYQQAARRVTGDAMVNALRNCLPASARREVKRRRPWHQWADKFVVWTG